MTSTILSLIVFLLQIYSFLIILRAVVSWARLNPMNQYIRLLCDVTDPALKPIQAIIPPLGGSIDISPIIVLLLLQLIKGLIVGGF